MAQELQCPACGKAIGPNPCLKCDGKGSVKWMLVLNSVCPACFGAGTQDRCPDLLQHVQTGKSAGPRPATGNICPECNGAGFHRRFGGLVGGARCPTCGGKGLFDQTA